VLGSIPLFFEDHGIDNPSFRRITT